MKFLSLFAGIGGADLGLERAGMECAGQVEIESFCQKVLAKHWPNVWRWNDVKTLTGAQVAEHCGTIDLLVGGVPCQPASVAGKRLGTADYRWLWPDFLRLVSEVKPMWVLAENPRGVLSLDVAGMQFSEWIAHEFTARGYELLPVKLAAEDVGAPHRRERIFFIGRSLDDASRQQNRRLQFRELEADAGTTSDNVANIHGGRGGASRAHNTGRQSSKEACGDGVGISILANAFNAGLEGQRYGTSGTGAEISLPSGFGSYCWPSRPGQHQYEWEEPRTVELQVGESASGLPVRLVRRHRVAALKALGNAIVPQVAEVIGRAIMRMEAETPELRRAA